eukprot:28533-Eustigmatos_ZCMA.PRE.1
MDLPLVLYTNLVPRPIFSAWLRSWCSDPSPSLAGTKREAEESDSGEAKRTKCPHGRRRDR